MLAPECVSYFHKGPMWRGAKVEKSRKIFLEKSRKVLAIINNFLSKDLKIRNFIPLNMNEMIP